MKPDEVGQRSPDLVKEASGWVLNSSPDSD